MLYYYRNNQQILFILKSKMSILTWIKLQEQHGRSCFSMEEIQQEFPQKARPVLLSELSRLRHMHILANVHNGFYVKFPVQYVAKGFIPPFFYIDQLMNYLKKPYYVSLLTAAQLFGAAHQAPQRFCVFTTRPVMNTSEAKNPIIFWRYRQKISSKLLIKRNSETSEVFFSCPELTSVDVVQYSQYIGGLSSAATVLAELLDSTNFAKVDNSLFDFSSVSAFQRLGYIM